LTPPKTTRAVITTRTSALSQVPTPWEDSTVTAMVFACTIGMATTMDRTSSQAKTVPQRREPSPRLM
jgi:hypothetical protein